MTSTALGPLPVTDAKGWSETITVTRTIDSKVTDTNPNGQTVGTYHTSGTATYTYSRATLDDVVVNAKLLLAYGQDLTSRINGGTLPQSTFLPIQSALGRQPGWIVYFGTQPPQKNVYTTTFTPAPGSGYPPQPDTYSDDNGVGLSLSCGQCAPGRFTIGTTLVYDAGTPLLPSLNDGLTSDQSNSSSPTINTVLLQAGVPADSTTEQAAIGPVYRVSIDDDTVVFAVNITLVVNGTSQTAQINTGATQSFFLLGGAFASAVLGCVGRAGLYGAQVYGRSPTSGDVQLPNATDSLGGGSIDYANGYVQADSTLNLGGKSITLDDPFNLSGQSFTNDDDPTNVMTVQF